VLRWASVVAVACLPGPGRGSEQIVSGSRSYEAWAPALDAPGYRVAPDRAVLPVGVSAEDPRAAVDALAKALPAGCTLRITGYVPPRRIDAAMDVSFAGMADVRARMDQLDRCLAPFAGRSDAALGETQWVVDHPEQHFDALAERLVATQQAAASIVAPGVHPEDRRCVPTGAVLPSDPRISGVALALEVTCSVVSAP
jgi:hypothetical protein